MILEVSIADLQKLLQFLDAKASVPQDALQHLWMKEIFAT